MQLDWLKPEENHKLVVSPFKLQLLKWIGNKQRFAHEIISYFPKEFNTYYEPFLGSGAVLGTLAPDKGIASDILEPLIQIWQTLSDNPDLLNVWYKERWEKYQINSKESYEKIKASFNDKPNPADMLFLSRSCYGGVVRFRKDGYMSTPIGPHKPVSPESMQNRISVWHERVSGTKFYHLDFEQAISQAEFGDIVYCDPPYSDTQAILYGSQSFSLKRLLRAIKSAKERGAYVVLSIDGSKKSGKKNCKVEIPEGLFERTININCGRSMLRRLQMEGQTLENEVVSDKLLLTY